MAVQNKPESHSGFFMVMGLLAVAIIGCGVWWFMGNSVDADKEQTAQLNQPSHKPKDAAKKPGDTAPSASAAPAGATDNK